MCLGHINAEILMLSLPGTERDQSCYRRVYLVGRFLFVRLDIGVGIRLHYHVNNNPAVMLDNFAVNEHLQRLRYRTELKVGLRERLYVKACTL